MKAVLLTCKKGFISKIQILETIHDLEVRDFQESCIQFIDALIFTFQE